MGYRLTLSYRGGGFSGWQRQPGERTVQAEVEAALEKWTGDELTVVGAGRTDAGVHARGQVAHLVRRDGEEAPPELALRALVHGTNRFLPEDIRVLAAARVPPGFDARKCAESKRYSYRILRQVVISPLDAEFSVTAPEDLDVDAMMRAAAEIVGRHDFTAFALAGGAHTDPRRRVFEAAFETRAAEIVFSIVGEGFLRGMVRSLAGTLLEIGRGRRSVASFRRLLEGAPRSEAGPTAPARGLVLEWVKYPDAWRPAEVYDASGAQSVW